MDDPSGPTLRELVARLLERIDDEGSAAIEAFCAEHPGQADALRGRLAQLRGLGLVPDGGGNAAVPEQLGEFRLRRRLGGGGMGVVYEAEQQPLGRLVALKLIRPDQLYFPGARERFARELQAVARLSHPGIVPVYAGGERAGLPFCAMELVEGASLEEILVTLRGRDPATLTGADLQQAVLACVRTRDGEAPAVPAVPTAPEPSDGSRAGATGPPSARPGVTASRARPALFASTWTAACLRVARAVAAALAHAHERGVLHRDVKPSNIMVTPDGRVLLLDFGLARAEGDERLTSSGSHLGSLAFMSPEQVRGEHATLDGRSDVYSLGVTLHELLGLRPPFGEDGPEATRRRILDGRAASLREANPAVPRDAETVCLHALDRDRERRYAGAAEFGADLANVLELRPIGVRPPGALLRARRWAQRRPARATGLALGLLLLLAGPLGWELNRLRNERELKQAYDRSERNFGVALQAVGHVLREMATTDLEDVPRMQQARLAAMDRALEVFPALQADRPDDPLVLSEGAELHASRGDVLRDLGRPEEARAEFNLAIDTWRRLVEADPAPANRSNLAAALNQLGKAEFATYRMQEALPPYGEAIEQLRLTLAVEPDSPARLRELAVTLANLDEALRGLGRADEALAANQEALDLAERCLAARPGDADATWTRARILSDRCSLLRDGGRNEDSLAAGERSLLDYRAAAAADPGSRFRRFDVTTGLITIADAEQGLRRFDDAEARLAEALAIMDDLLRDFPDSQRYHTRRLELLKQLGTTAGRKGDHARARELLLAEAAERERLISAEPDRCDLQVDWAITQLNIANSLVQQGLDADGARGRLHDAIERMSACDARGELPAADRDALLNARYLLALIACQTGDRDGALAAVTEFDTHAPDGPMARRQAADLWNEWLLLLDRAGEPDGPGSALADARAKCLDRLGQAIDAGYADTEELRTTPSLDVLRDDPGFDELLARAAAGGGAR